MTAVPFGERLLPDGRLSAYACGAGIRHTTARCPRDVGPYTYSRGMRLVLADDRTHHALVEPAEVISYATHVDDIQAKRERIGQLLQHVVRVKRVAGRPVTMPESEEDFFARVGRDVCGLAEERDKAQGHIERVREAPREAVAVDLRAAMVVDPKGVVIR